MFEEGLNMLLIGFMGITQILLMREPRFRQHGLDEAIDLGLNGPGIRLRKVLEQPLERGGGAWLIQYSILILSRPRLVKKNKAPEKIFIRSSISTIAAKPSIDFRKST